MRAPITILPVLLVIAGGVCQPLHAASPDQPKVSLLEGTALVNLARTAMTSYLDHRTPVGSMPIPKKFHNLANRRYGVALSLRNRGKLLARNIITEHELGENLIAAALQAMRCESLPDRITKSYLDSLVVEIEVLGPCESARADDVCKTISPGLTGLKLTCQDDVANLLPSTAYLLRLDADEIVRKCKLGLRRGKTNPSKPITYEVFATRHFVGYPDGLIVSLYRGKSLAPVEAINDATISFAAHRVGMYLIANQDSDGRYSTLGSQTTLRDHLHAAYAMGRLWQHTQEQRYNASAAKALQYAKGQVTHDDDVAYVSTTTPADQLAATAWLVIALNETGEQNYESELQAELLGALAHNVIAGKDKLPSAAMDGSDSGQARLRDACIAYFALAAYGKNDQTIKAAQILNALLTELSPEDAETRLWYAWTCVYANNPANNPDRTGKLKLSFVRDGNCPDELGGLLCNDKLTPTHVSAMAAVVATVYPELWSNIEQADELAAAARTFCYQMMYKPREAYTESRPYDMVGAVRAEATSARVSLQACAAAIEAFLAIPPDRPAP